MQSSVGRQVIKVGSPSKLDPQQARPSGLRPPRPRSGGAVGSPLDRHGNLDGGHAGSDGELDGLDGALRLAPLHVCLQEPRGACQLPLPEGFGEGFGRARAAPSLLAGSPLGEPVREMKTR